MLNHWDLMRPIIVQKPEVAALQQIPDTLSQVLCTARKLSFSKNRLTAVRFIKMSKLILLEFSQLKIFYSEQREYFLKKYSL
jgi:hypothetical protein